MIFNKGGGLWGAIGGLGREWKERKGSWGWGEAEKSISLRVVGEAIVQTSKGKGGRKSSMLDVTKKGRRGNRDLPRGWAPGSSCLSALSLAIRTYRWLSLGNLSNWPHGLRKELANEYFAVIKGFAGQLIDQRIKFTLLLLSIVGGYPGIRCIWGDSSLSEFLSTFFFEWWKSTHQTHRVKQSKTLAQLEGKQQTPEVAQDE